MLLSTPRDKMMTSGELLAWIRDLEEQLEDEDLDEGEEGEIVL